MEGDFNPDEHDKRMSELFNSEYYSSCADETRPEFPELDEELEIGKFFFFIKPWLMFLIFWLD